MKAIYRWGIAGAVCAAGVGAWYLLGEDEQQSFRFKTTKPVRGVFTDKVQATGTLEPSELVDVGAQVTGEIKEFGTDLNGKRIDYGSEVKAGQLLARIDDTIVELDIQRAEASVAQAKAQIASAAAAVSSAKAGIQQAQSNFNRAERDFKRAEKLGVGDALSQMDYDQYINARETAAANLESAKAQLETAEAQQQNADAQLLSAQAQLKSELRNRDYTRITTPVDGTIVVRQVNVGQTVVSNMSATTLFLVARDLRHMQIWTSVNEADIAKIRPGQLVRYTVDAMPNQNFTGTVNKIRPNATMSSNVVTYIVEVDIENPDRKLLPYMSANANFIVFEQKDALMIPDAAFSFKPSPDMLAPGAAEALKRRPAPPAGAPAPESPAPSDQSPAEGAEQAADDAADGSAEAAEAPAEEAVSYSPAVVWTQQKDGKLFPVRVLRGTSDGARSIVRLLPGESLDENTLLVTGVERQAVQTETVASKGETNLFGPKRPERRPRGTGGVEAKPGQDTKGNRGPGGPPPN